MKFGLLGFPLGHSFSRIYFEEKFKQEGLQDFSYQNFEIRSASELGSFIRSDIFGFNVTSPYKAEIITCLNQIDRPAFDTQAVNTVVRTGQYSWKGFNTDITGFRDSVLDWYKSDALPQQALILGAGGASRAVQYALREIGINCAVVARQPGSDYTFDNLTVDIIRQYPLIVNATPLGTAPVTDVAPPLPWEGITSGHRLYDLVYNPANTLFLTRGQQMGARVKNGLDMLHRQAEHAWAIWKTYGNF